MSAKLDPAEIVDALHLHEACPVIDLHADTLLWARWAGYDMLRAHEPPLPKAALFGHIDVPRMKQGGLGAQFFGLVSMPVGKSGLFQALMEQIDCLEDAIARSHGELVLARSSEDVHACARRGKRAALLGIEGAHALEGSLHNLERLAARGARYLGLLHFTANACGFPAYGKGRDDSQGLTRFGYEVIERAEDLGVIVDLAHINPRGFLEATRACKKPPMVTHTGVLGAYEHWRNIDDAQLKAVADKGGCVGVIFCPQFLGGDGLAPVVKHLKHIVSVVGEDTPALGSDWDGFIVPTKELKDPRGLPLLTQALLEAGMPARVVEKILRKNALRVLQEHPVDSRVSMESRTQP
jgi:membrane dipeptidase